MMGLLARGGTAANYGVLYNLMVAGGGTFANGALTTAVMFRAKIAQVAGTGNATLTCQYWVGRNFATFTPTLADAITPDYETSFTGASSEVAAAIGFMCRGEALAPTKYWAYEVSTALVANTIATTRVGRTGVQITVGAASGGTGPYTYDLWEKAGSGAYALKTAGIAIGSRYVTGLSSGTVYKHKIVVTDSAAGTVESNELTNTPIYWALGATGDSNTDPAIVAGGTAIYKAGLSIATISGLTATGFPFGVSGTLASSDGAAAAAITNGLGLQLFTYMFGTNNAKTAYATSKAAFKSTVQAFITSFIAASTNTWAMGFIPLLMSS